MARKPHKPGQFRKGHDPRRHVFTTEQRSKGGQVTWRKLMVEQPELLAWLQRKINKTASHRTLAAYKRRGGRITVAA